MLSKTQPSPLPSRRARSPAGTRHLDPDRGVPTVAPRRQRAPRRENALRLAPSTGSPGVRAVRTRELEPWRIPVRAQWGEGGPRPSRPSAQVPRSHTADPAAPRSTPPAQAASEAPCDRISLSLFPAGGAAAAAAAVAEPAPQRPPWPPAPSPPGRSLSHCSSPGCRRRRPGDSGRKPARRRRRRPHRPPRCCPSPPTCPRARRSPSAARRRGGRSAPGAATTSGRAAACEGLARTCSARRARPAARLEGRSGGAAATPRWTGGGGRGRGRGGDRSLKDAAEDPPGPAPGGGSGAWQAQGPGLGSCARRRECVRVGARGRLFVDTGEDRLGSAARDGPPRG